MASAPDSTARVALAGRIVRPRFLAFLDFDGDPVRATTWMQDLSFGASETGDPILDGHTFLALRPDLVRMSPLNFGDRGAETLTIELSGLSLDPEDADRYTMLLDDSNWLLRRAVIYQGVAGGDYAPAGGIWRVFLGRMTNVRVRGSRQEQVIAVSIESARAMLSRAPGRTYLDQSRYDADDRSAEAAIGSANMGTNIRTGLAPGTGGGTASGRRESMHVRPV